MTAFSSSCLPGEDTDRDGQICVSDRAEVDGSGDLRRAGASSPRLASAPTLNQVPPGMPRKTNVGQLLVVCQDFSKSPLASRSPGPAPAVLSQSACQPVSHSPTRARESPRERLHDDSGSSTGITGTLSATAATI